MHVAKIKRRHGDRVYVSHLVRRSVREGKRVRHETIANVSKLPPAAIEALSAALRGEAVGWVPSRCGSPSPSPPGTPKRCWGPRGVSAWPACSIAPPQGSATWRWR